MNKQWVRLAFGAALSVSLVGQAFADNSKITVFAAASLTNAMQDIAAQYQKGKTVEPD